jgi:nicotinate-nucleotide pyrophosphorylase (carboxylating)
MLSKQEQLNHFIQMALQEDVGNGDHSTLGCIPAGEAGKAVLKVKQSGILAGMEVAEEIFRWLSPSAVFTPLMKDGDTMHPDSIAFEVEAPIHAILKGERLVLNTLQRMSGIATLTQTYVQKIKNYSTKILDTRKTTPNFRLLEKMAVRIGGAVNHRMGLYDMIMLKDNHIDFCGGLVKAVELSYAYSQQLPNPLSIEVETRNLQDVELALSTGKVNRIMLDNFTPQELQKAIQLIANCVETEASGGIHLDNICEYASTGVDYISVGALIHQAKSLDLSLKAVLVG